MANCVESKKMLSKFFHHSQNLCVYVLSCVQLFATPWTVDCQAPLSWQEYQSGLPFPTPGDLPNPGIKPISLASPALAGGFFTTVPAGKPLLTTYKIYKIGIILLIPSACSENLVK